MAPNIRPLDKYLVYAVFIILISAIFLNLILLIFSPFFRIKDTCTNIPNTNRSDGLILYYNFNNNEYYGENERIVCDLSGNNNTGFVYGSSWSANSSLFGDGSFQFDGKKDIILVMDSDYLSPSINGLTVSFFINPGNHNFIGEGSNNDYIHYLGKGSSLNGYEWAFRLYNSSNSQGRNSRFSFYAFNLAGGLGAGSYFQDIPDNNWTHVAGVINQSHIKIYKNGALRDIKPLSEYNISPENGNSNLLIGTLDGSSYFTGSIDELRIYHYELNDSQITDLYNYPLSGGKNDLHKAI